MTPIAMLTITLRRLLIRRALFVSAVAAGGALIAGCAGEPPTSGSAGAFVGNTGGGGTGRQHRSEATALQDADISAVQAATTASRTVAGTIESIELELEHGIPTWEVDLLTADGTWHELEIDGVGGAVLTRHTEIDGEDADETAALKAARVTVTEAAAAAKSARGIIFSAELDDHLGRQPTWKIRTLERNGTRHQQTVDALTGAVTTSSPQSAGGEN